MANISGNDEGNGEGGGAHQDEAGEGVVPEQVSFHLKRTKNCKGKKCTGNCSISSNKRIEFRNSSSNSTNNYSSSNDGNRCKKNTTSSNY